jgi:hypothetical protein
MIATAVGYYVLFNSIKKKNILIADASLGSQELEAQKSSVKAIQNVLKGSEAEVALIESYFVSEDGAVDFIEYLEGLGREALVNLSIQSVEENKDSVRVPEKSELKFKIAVQGSWRSVYRFLHILEKIPYHVDISFVDIKKGGADIQFDQGVLPVEGIKKVSSDGSWRGDFDFSILTNK